MTFDVTQATFVAREHGWQDWYECFCVCRHCQGSTIFVLAITDPRHSAAISSASSLVKLSGSLNDLTVVKPYVVMKDSVTVPVPEHVPDDVGGIFKEAAMCMAAGCYNAAATMFRLCLDLATRGMLPPAPPETPGLNHRTRRDLGLRLPWLFENNVLPASLRDLSNAVKEDGNDGAHAGTVSSDDVDDLLDFATALLERIYTEPRKLQLAKERRDARRSA